MWKRDSETFALILFSVVLTHYRNRLIWQSQKKKNNGIVGLSRALILKNNNNNNEIRFSFINTNLFPFNLTVMCHAIRTPFVVVIIIELVYQFVDGWWISIYWLNAHKQQQYENEKNLNSMWNLFYFAFNQFPNGEIMGFCSLFCPKKFVKSTFDGWWSTVCNMCSIELESKRNEQTAFEHRHTNTLHRSLEQMSFIMLS